ncbi:MAG: ATP-binding protein [Roseofilum sp. SID3]|uniref:AAA family ATPase n=1 Tax=Roseofilum sp. SID3 TaxID=2821499 RepID=UPI001B2EDB68|nr:ATP-binding protein [Roseofilum sp. SID3]MBP0015306.1 ATP-binding protein [Roseofilum sp. SID3]
MLIQFAVNNYRSIRKCQTLSLVACENLELFQDTHLFPIGSEGKQLLKSAAIYGANGSGKTNLLNALKTLQDVVLNSASQVEGEFDVQSCFFGPPDFPTELSVVFLENNIRYEYGVSLLKSHVVEEWLIAYSEEESQLIFSRKHRDEPYDDDWSFPLTPNWGFDEEIKKIKEEVRSNSLCLSHAANSNHPQLTSAFNWFRHLYVVMGLNLEGVDKSEEAVRFFDYMLQTKRVVAIDGLGKDLHPLLVKKLVELIHDFNPCSTQLIFTTHTTALMDMDLFRRDQIWFTDKEEQYTTLYSLLEFKPRESKPPSNSPQGERSLQQDYLVGRYGAVPFV